MVKDCVSDCTGGIACQNCAFACCPFYIIHLQICIFQIFLYYSIYLQICIFKYFQLECAIPPHLVKIQISGFPNVRFSA